MKLDRSHVVLGKVVPGGGTGAVAALRCSQGGVSWPQVIVFYDAGMHVLGSADLADITRGGRENVRGMRLSGHAVHVEVVNIAQHEDPGCCGTRSASLTLRYLPDAHKVVATSVRFYDERVAAANLVKALRRGAVRQAARWASPNVIATLMRATTPATRRTLSLGKCYGALDFTGDATFLGRAPRGCQVTARASGQQVAFGLRMQPRAWNRWRAASAVSIDPRGR